MIETTNVGISHFQFPNLASTFWSRHRVFQNVYNFVTSFHWHKSVPQARWWSAYQGFFFFNFFFPWCLSFRKPEPGNTRSILLLVSAPEAKAIGKVLSRGELLAAKGLWALLSSAPFILPWGSSYPKHFKFSFLLPPLTLSKNTFSAFFTLVLLYNTEVPVLVQFWFIWKYS